MLTVAFPVPPPPPQFVVHGVFTPLHDVSGSATTNAKSASKLFERMHTPHDRI
jgi:hypothetical protein